jgi:hypothetical protein
MSYLSNLPAGGPAPYGQLATLGVRPTVQSGTFDVGTPTHIGQIPFPGTSAKGKRESEKKIVQAYKTKLWGKWDFEKDQQQGQLLFCVRAAGQRGQELAMATLPQFNALLRDVHERTKSIARVARLGTPEDNDDARMREFVYQMRDGANDFSLLGAANGRMTPDVRRRALDYFSVEGILTRWNYLGVYSNDGGRDMKNQFLINVSSQGPEYVANVFQPIDETVPGGEIDIGPPVRAGDHCSLVLKRRFSPTTLRFEEFCVVPVASASRYIDMEQLEFENPETGLVEYGAQIYVGRVLDVVGERPDGVAVRRMRGIGVPWRDAHAAHKENTARVKLALGFEAGNAAA